MKSECTGSSYLRFFANALICASPEFHEPRSFWYRAGWGVVGLAGVVVWLARGRKDPLGKTVETVGYYMNPYEWWAYSRDDHWRPQGMVDGVGWTRPWVMPLATARALRAGGEPCAQ